MVGVLDEMENINNFILYGFKYSKQWTLDMGLFVRWKKKDLIDVGIKPTKKMMREILNKKCEESLLWFDEDKYFKKIKKVVDDNWNKEFNPISIKKMLIPKEIINWFIDEYKNRKINKNEIKFLFTLYIGYRIKQCFNFKKENLLKFYKDGDKVFLKNNSNIQKSMSIRKIMYLLFDKKYIYIEKNGSTFICDFIKDNNLFNDMDKVLEENKCEVLYTADLYACGDWIWKYMQVHKRCEVCGRLIENSHNRKYCPDCAKKKYKYKEETNYFKKITCVDCGKTVVVSTKNNHGEDRCEECQKKAKREYDKELKREEYKPQEEKTIKCIDCGKEFIITGNSKRTRCNNCYKEHVKKKDRERKQKQRESKNSRGDSRRSN